MSLLRKLVYPELVTLVGWAEQEGWEPGHHDAAQFWNYDPEGFLAIEEGGEFLGGGAIIKHSDQFGFMGLFIVSPEMRGRGLGTRLWYARRDALLERLGDSATIGLDGVDAMVPFYAKGGFEQATRHRRFRYQGSDIPSMADHHHVSLQDVPENDLTRYDRQCFPAERLRFVRQWSQQKSATGLASYHDGNLQGFGVIRRCTSGWRVGPLFADDVQVANDLFDSFLVGTEALPVFIDVPDANQEGIHWVQQRGMEEVFGCERMYYGKAPEIDHSKIFGVSTLEIG